MSNLSPRPTAVADRPTPPATPIDKMETLDSAFFSRPDVMERFQQTVPKFLSPERMLRVCALAVNKTPKLRECTPMSLLGAMLVLASLGLEPNTPLGHAYLIPFGAKKKVKDQNGRDKWIEITEVQVVIGYKGYIELARRSGSLISIHADVVYDTDEFSYEYGSQMHLRHRPIGDNEGKPGIYAYAHVKLKDGEAFEVLPYARVLRLRNSSQGYQAAVKAKADAERNSADAWKMKTYTEAPWVKYEHEMAAKTMIRRVSKTLPMSIEMMVATQLDERSEFGPMNFGSVVMSNDVLGSMGDIIDNTAQETLPEGDETPSPQAEEGKPATTAPEGQKTAEAPKQETNQDQPKEIVLIAPDGKELTFTDETKAVDELMQLIEDAETQGLVALEALLENQKLDQFKAAAMLRAQFELRIAQLKGGK